MDTNRESLNSEALLDLQQKYLSDQLRHQNHIVDDLRKTRGRSIIRRSLSLFAGLALILFGIVYLLIMTSFDETVWNILLFGLSLIIGIPLLIPGFVLFRGLPIEKEIITAAGRLIEMQDSLEQLRHERSNKVQAPSFVVEPALQALAVSETLLDTEVPIPENASPVCPECGNEIRSGSKICRKCGHLFI